MSWKSQYVSTDSLPRPRWIGRAVRLLLGFALLHGAWSGIRFGEQAMVDRVPRFESWVAIAIALWLLPAVIDIGWRVEWRRRSQLLVVAIGGALSLGGWVLLETAWPPVLGAFALGLVLYVFLHLGISFVLSAILATPGCEMRALAHLWTRLTGRSTTVHFCPGPIGKLDAWELSRRASSD